MTVASRITVLCSACDWQSQRRPESALDEPCPLCGGAVVRGRSTRGPAPAPAELRRVEVRVRVLPATAAAMTAAEMAAVLERAVKRRRNATARRA